MDESRFRKVENGQSPYENVGAINDIEEHLKENYKKTGHPIAFAGINNIYKYYGGKLSVNKIKQILSGIESYTLHREFHKSVRNHSFSNFKRYQFQMDLVDIQHLSAHNDNVKYLLNVIDTFTRYAFVRPLKDKSASTVLKAFKSILNDAGEKPYMIVMDKGTEFKNRQFDNFCAENNIKLINPQTQTHAAYIERFNRTLQQLIYKFMTENETNRFIDNLETLVNTYNNRLHRMIQTSPFKAETDGDSALNINILASKNREKIKKQKPKYQVNSYVRIAKQKTKFSRGYDEQAQREIFRIWKIDVSKRIPLYHLETYDKSEKLQGGFYAYELTPVETEIFRIERVIKKRKYRGKNQLFVKWKGFNDTYNSWIDEADVEQEF